MIGTCRGRARVTLDLPRRRDVDLLIPRDVANAERVLAALSELTSGIARELEAAAVAAAPSRAGSASMPRGQAVSCGGSRACGFHTSGWRT